MLARLSSKELQRPFIVCLFCTFQDSDNLYFALSLARSEFSYGFMLGDLLQVLLSRPDRVFSVGDARFYAAEILNALGDFLLFAICLIQIIFIPWGSFIAT